MHSHLSSQYSWLGTQKKHSDQHRALSIVERILAADYSAASNSASLARDTGSLISCH